jgi:hypothetical protein
MTDQWVPAPPPVPRPPSEPLPPANSWNPSPPCSSGDYPSIVDGVIITGVPATVSSLYWQVSLNDGSAPPNFQINQLDGQGNFVDTVAQASGADGSVRFNTDVTCAANLSVPDLSNLSIPGGPVGTYLGSASTSGQLTWFQPPISVDAPTDGYLYGRTQGVWASGGTFSQPLYMQGNNMLALVGASGSQRAILGGTGSAIPPPQSIAWRWQMMLGDQTAETGSDSGSNFLINPISDAGAIRAAAFTINRATGQATFSQPLTIRGPLGNVPALVIPKGTGGTSAIQGQSNAGLPRWQLSLANVNAELGSNAGSNFQLDCYNDNGTIFGSPLTIARSSGIATFTYGLQINGPAAFNSLLALNNVGNLSIPGGVAGDALVTNGAGLLSWSAPPGGLSDAPNDGTTYARNSAAWAHLTSADITDWATQLANYYPTSNPAGYQTAAQVTAALAPYALTANVPVGSNNAPLMNGTAAAGLLGTWSRADHVHPSDTSRYAASNPSGYQTAAQVTAALPPASTTTPLVDGIAAIGTSGAFARADHVHPLPPQAIGDNRIINGDMRIDQRGVASGAGGTANGYTVDRWTYSGTQSTKGTWARGGSAVGFGGYLLFTSSSAYSLATTDTFSFYQPIEADTISDFQWGTANAQPVTLSFWAQSSLGGMFGGSIRNSATNRSYTFSFSLVAAGPWTKIIILVPGDTAGTWTLSGNGVGLYVAFNLGSGANFSIAAGAWTNGNYVGPPGAVSVVGTNAAYLALTGVKLEVGSVATPYNRQSLAKSMADCQRYYQVGYAGWTGYGAASGSIGYGVTLETQMRAAPTIQFSSSGYANASGLGSGSITSYSFQCNATATATGAAAYTTAYTASAEL